MLSFFAKFSKVKSFNMVRDSGRSVRRLCDISKILIDVELNKLSGNSLSLLSLRSSSCNDADTGRVDEIDEIAFP